MKKKNPDKIRNAAGIDMRVKVVVVNHFAKTINMHSNFTVHKRDRFSGVFF